MEIKFINQLAIGQANCDTVTATANINADTKRVCVYSELLIENKT